MAGARYLLLGLAALVLSGGTSWGDDHCPSGVSSTYTFFQGDASYDAEQGRLEALAPAASGQPVCILAFYATTYDKMFAFRRATWVRQTLMGKGVPATAIAIEFRPDAPGTAKDEDHLVQVILGH